MKMNLTQKVVGRSEAEKAFRQWAETIAEIPVKFKHAV